MDAFSYSTRKQLTQLCLQGRRGFGILEIVLGATILTTVFGAASLFYQKGIQESRDALNRTQATLLASEGIEAARVMRDADWSNISGPTDGTSYYLYWTGTSWATSTAPSLVNDIFEWTITYNDVYRDATTHNIVESGGVLDSDARKITSVVSWYDHGATTTRSVATYFTDLFTP
jgi:hypothetical protein